jgi:hypothetical protein
MKYRFAVEVELPLSSYQSAEQMEMVLNLVLEKGREATGHSPTTLQYSVEKIRQRSLDLDKKVGEQ